MKKLRVHYLFIAFFLSSSLHAAVKRVQNADCPIRVKNPESGTWESSSDEILESQMLIKGLRSKSGRNFFFKIPGSKTLYGAEYECLFKVDSAKLKRLRKKYRTPLSRYKKSWGLGLGVLSPRSLKVGDLFIEREFYLRSTLALSGIWIFTDELNLRLLADWQFLLEEQGPSQLYGGPTVGLGIRWFTVSGAEGAQSSIGLDYGLHLGYRYFVRSKYALSFEIKPYFSSKISGSADAFDPDWMALLRFSFH